ncbi:MAG: hypothetical protein ACJ71Y_11860 [Blastococcus sp.]|jgi:hypothetical protein
MTMTHEQADRERQMREGLETGFTDQEWAVGYVLCPAREKCPSGLRSLFKPLKNGRLPMHRDWIGYACPGARQKPTTPPLQLRPAP